MKPISKLKKCVARSIYDERENVNDRFGEIANKKKKKIGFMKRSVVVISVHSPARTCIDRMSKKNREHDWALNKSTSWPIYMYIDKRQTRKSCMNIDRLAREAWRENGGKGQLLLLLFRQA